MFNFSSASITGAMRPGLLSGQYPERGDRENGWLERVSDMLQGRVACLRIDHQTRLRKVAEAVNRQGKPLSSCDTGQLAKRLLDLRRQFYRCGLSDSLCIQAFALIRELAERTIHLRHYDSQVMSGWAILQGQLAEMETGEGKTLAATLAAATAALAGIPVHIITVNDYLVERDAQAMGPLYRALGLTVGTVLQDMLPEQRRDNYACDITYCTNKQVAFDYLRDRLQMGNIRSPLRLQLESAYAENSRISRLLLRGLCFAIVDEADSVLIDEARTPLILTRKVDNITENQAYQQALLVARQLENGRDFYLDPAERSVRLSLAGQQKLAQLPSTEVGFRPNLWWREELVRQALHALYLLHRDCDYLVREDKVLIIDAHTGRTMPDRSWERGLHQLVEAKEGCPLTEAREPLGRLTYQRFFRRYLRLGGMTGTAREVSSELWSIYGLRVQRIPLHRPSRRREMPARIFSKAEQKWSAVTTAVLDMQQQGRPVLIGTGSVADSELLSHKLTLAGIAHRVLNARQDKEEAEIIAAAGRLRQVTVATNMAGRGTDIPLAPGVAELGGLHVIAACRNEAKRIDRQLSGRCARQGDPGSHQAFLSLEDTLIRQNDSLKLSKLPGCGIAGNLALRHRFHLYLFRRAQRRIERRHFEARRALLQFDRQTGRMLAFSGHLE